MKLKYWLLTVVTVLAVSLVADLSANSKAMAARHLTTTKIKSIKSKKATNHKAKKVTWSKRLRLRKATASTKFKANIRKNAIMTKSIFRSKGRVHWHKRVFTYYSPNGSRATGMGSYTSDGTYTLRGYDAKGYLILANNKPFGTKIKTPLGWGIVHDRGTYGGHYDIVVK